MAHFMAFLRPMQVTNFLVLELLGHFDFILFGELPKLDVICQITDLPSP